MKKKKENLKISVRTIVTIILVIAVIVLGLVLFLPYKTEYKITQEVCHDEYELKGTFDLNGRHIPYEELCFEIDCGKRQNITLNIKNESKQVCEQQEVDEIKSLIVAPKDHQGFKYCECKEYYDFHKIFNVPENITIATAGNKCKEYGDCFIYMPISKDSLTKNWLDENAECIKKDYGKIIDGFPKFNRSDQTKSYEDYSLWGDSCWYNGGKKIFTCEENPRDFLCCYKKLEDNPGCSKYKLNNYTVEVKK